MPRVLRSVRKSEKSEGGADQGGDAPAPRRSPRVAASDSTSRISGDGTHPTSATVPSSVREVDTDAQDRPSKALKHSADASPSSNGAAASSNGAAASSNGATASSNGAAASSYGAAGSPHENESRVKGEEDDGSGQGRTAESEFLTQSGLDDGTDNDPVRAAGTLEEGNVGEPAPPPESRQEEAPPASRSARRQAWAQVARVRGAHFARPDRPATASNSRGSGTVRGRSSDSGSGARAAAEEPKEQWPGPWSEGRRLLKKREEAAARREALRVNGSAQAASDEGSDDEQDHKTAPVKLDWKPRGKGSRTSSARVVPSLFKLCLDLLAEHFDHVESLGDVSAQVRNHLASVLCRQLKLTTETLQRLSEPGVTELILPDCSRIEPDQMRASLLQCRTTLRVLRLGTCGRCVGDEAVEALASAGGVPRLEMAALSGTYQLTDSGVLQLLASCPRLRGLEIPANSRITRKALEAMVDQKRPVGSALTSLSLANCFQLGPEELMTLKDMTCLERLTLGGVTKLTDDVVTQALEAHGWKLRHLDISDCPNITDATLQAIGERCGVLESLSLGMCPLLTSFAIQELFQYSGSSADLATSAAAAATSKGTPGDAANRSKGKGKAKGKASMRTERIAIDADAFDEDEEEQQELALGISEGTLDDHAGKASVAAADTVSSTGGSAAVGHAMLKSRLTTISLRGLSQVDDEAIQALAAACSSSLRELDLKGVAMVTDNSLACLAQYCSSSLETVDLSFCRAITDDGLGHLVDSSPKMRLLRLWGCTQVTARFLQGHSRKELVISRY